MNVGRMAELSRVKYVQVGENGLKWTFRSGQLCPSMRETTPSGHWVWFSLDGFGLVWSRGEG